NPSPTSVGSGSVTWNQSALGFFQERDLHVRLQVPPDVGLLGTELFATITTTPANTDGDPANNTATAAVTVTGSYDPNDKTAFTSSRTSDASFLLDQDEWIDYVIRFQNTGTDTAFNVIVTDTLPHVLDPASISLVAASHPHVWSMEAQGTLKFIFPMILLPDSNVNEPASHGLISFRIRPRQPVLPGTTIANIANIHFDFNPPVITEPSVLVAEFSTEVDEAAKNTIEVWPVPAKDRLNIRASSTITSVRVLAHDGREVNIPTPGAPSSLDVSGLHAGAYLLVVGFEGGATSHAHFIIHQ
ncbi:MAG: T9SS type A sorting domain-containing protein, partial [Flavobacteriales bacterium]